MTKRGVLISILLLAGACASASLEPVEPVEDVGQEIVIGGGQCGTSTCGAGSFCCNSSCGVCAPIGGACLDVYCDPAEAASMSPDERDELVFVGGLGGQQCGYVTCGKGQHCCNASCSRCVPFGMECTQESCD
jgi:hypothetical protein